ncbi:MAG: ion channel [Bdellovibrionia bacterium]
MISIVAALAVGFWIPLRLIHVELSYSLNIFFDLMVSIISVVNLYLYFKETKRAFWSLRSWFHLSPILDLLCAMPLIYLDQVLFDSQSKSLFLLNLLSARHIWRIKVFLDEFHSLLPVVYRLVPIGLTMPLLVHLVACAWIALGSGTAGPDPDRVTEYIKAIYWAFTTLTTVGYGDISAKTNPQMLFAAFVQVTGVGVFGFVLSNVASLLSRLDAAREHHMESLDRIETFMKSHQIPPDLRTKVRTYYHYLWKNNKGYQDHTLLEGLPVKMQSELFFFINRSIVEKVPILRGASVDLIEDLMNELKPRILVPGERVFRLRCTSSITEPLKF